MKRLYTIVVIALALTAGCERQPLSSSSTVPLIVATEQPKPESTPPKKPVKPATYTSKDLRAAVLGLTSHQVKELLGAPDEIETAGGGSWYYRNLVIDPDTGKHSRAASILFKRDVVENVLFNPPHKHDPR